MHIPMFDASRLLVRDDELIWSAFSKVVGSCRFILGESVRFFEKAFAAYVGSEEAIGVGNGTDALELALAACGVRAGDRVLTAANAGGYATTAILARGAVPAWVDVDEQTMLVTPKTLRAELERDVKAVVLTHLYGRMACVEEIVELCSARGVPVIEDCAQAHGAKRLGRSAGSVGALGCFSFYPTKNLGALGDGGAIVTSDRSLAARLRSLRQYGWENKYVVTELSGRNSRLDEIQAAVLTGRLEGLDRENRRRREIAQRYIEEMRNPRIRLPLSPSADDVVHLFVIRCTDRASLRAHLLKSGIDSEIHYPVPDHCQPAWAGIDSNMLPVTEIAANEVLSIPCHPLMTEDEVARVIRAVNSHG